MAFKNNAPFISCISKINNTLIDNAEHLNIVMPMYNLIEYCKKYKKKQGIYGTIIGMKQNSGAVGNINYSIRSSKSFHYKTKITERLEGTNTEKEEVEIVVPLKHLSNF